METRVRFLVVGAFSIAVIVAGFLFVFWLQTAGGLSTRRPIEIEFARSAGGLRPGAAVLFNGVRVGEVVSVAFDPLRPGIVEALASVDAAAPVRTDARVAVEGQGLMGTAAVALYGVSAQAPLIGSGGAPARLRSDSSGASMTEQARQALEKVDALLGDNASGIKDIVKNVDTFSLALSRNADRVDDVLAGLAQMAGRGPKPPAPRLYDLTAPADLPRGVGFGQVAVGDVKGELVFDTQHLLARPTPDGPYVIGEAQWTDTLPKLLQQKTVETLEHAHDLKTVSAALDQGAPDYQLLLDIRRFEIAGPALHAEVALAARLVGKDGLIVDGQLFEASAPAAAQDGPEAVKALDQAFGATERALAAWFGGLKP